MTISLQHAFTKTPARFAPIIQRMPANSRAKPQLGGAQSSGLSRQELQSLVADMLG